MADPIETRLREVYAAYSRGDLDPLLEWIPEDGEVARGPGLGTVRGHDAIREWLEPHVLEQRGEPIRFRAKGDRVWVELDWYARGVGSGAEVRATVFHVFTFRDGDPIRMEVHFDEAKALAAAGLAE